MSILKTIERRVGLTILFVFIGCGSSWASCGITAQNEFVDPSWAFRDCDLRPNEELVLYTPVWMDGLDLDNSAKAACVVEKSFVRTGTITETKPVACPPWMFWQTNCGTETVSVGVVLGESRFKKVGYKYW